MSNKVAPDVISGKRFSDHLLDLERGELDRDLTSTLNEVVKKVRENRGKGSVKLTLTIKPCDSAGKQVEVEASIDSKVPKAPRRKSLAFTDSNGRLLKDDPEQMNFNGEGFEND